MKTLNHSFFKSLYERDLFVFAINPLSYILGAIFFLYPLFNFFLRQQFFTAVGSTELHTFFQGISQICILVIPLLVSILKLDFQFSLNVGEKDSNIIFSKWLSLLTICAFFLLLTIFVPISVGFFGDVSVTGIVLGYAGIFLYICLANMLALLFSVWIQNQGAFFVTTIVFLALIHFAHLLPLYFPPLIHIQSILREISFAWHFDSFSKNIFDSRDIFFYIVGAIFLFVLTLFCIQKKRGKSYAKHLPILLLTFVLLLLDTNRFYFRLDFSSDKKFSTSQYSKTLLENVAEPLSITYYRSARLKELYPQVRDINDFLLSYALLSPYISYNIIDPSSKKAEKQNVRARLQAYGITGEPLRLSQKDTTSLTTVYSTIVINYLGQTAIIPFLLNTAHLEYDLTSRIQELIFGKKRSAQVLVGNGMSLETDYSYVKPWLESQGFSVVQSFLPSESEESGKQLSFTLLQETPLVVLGTSLFTIEDAISLESFIRRGGKVFIATAPYTIDLQNDWSTVVSNDYVVYMLQNFGLYFKEALVADISNFRLTLFSDQNSAGQTATAQTEYVNYPLWPILRSQKPIPSGMTLFWPCAQNLDEEVALQEGFSLKPLLYTSQHSWLLSGGLNANTNPFFVPQYPSEENEKGSFAVASAIFKDEQSAPSAIIIGDEYTFSTPLMAYSSTEQNADLRSLEFLSDSILTLTGNEEILDLKNKRVSNNSLYKISQNDFGRASFLTILLTSIIPIFVLGATAIFVHIKRKNLGILLNVNKESI